jgi:oligogalacturonide lyase
MNKREFLGLTTILGAAAATGALAAPPVLSTADKPAPGAPLPKDWIDKDTGHRVRRVSNHDQSQSFYFNVPAYSPDGKWMVFNRADGISLLDMATFEERILHTGELSAFSTSAVANVVFASKRGRPSGGAIEYFTIDMGSGAVKPLITSTQGPLISINADGTLMAGTLTKGTPPPVPAGQKVDLAQRLHADIPMEIFTLNIKTGERKVLTASSDWLNHLQFSPSDPNLLLYCHEGPWHEVDRVWSIRTDATQKQLIHKRTLNMEIAGHEFFSWDGEQVLYDLQTPRGEDFWLASLNLKTGQRIWYHLPDRNNWSVHYNISKDGTLMAGDGGQPSAVAKAPDGKWIWLFRPEIIPDAGRGAPNAAELIRPARMHPERLVNMTTHDYTLEPNVRFSPDGKWILFRSNMHGPTHVYAVSVDKA